MLKTLLGAGLVLMVWSVVILIGIMIYYIWNNRDDWM